MFFITGLGALLWFLIRVIPKPSRAAYPCMRAAAPVASAFVLYVLGLFATAAFFKKSKRLFSQSRHALASIFLLAGIFSAMLTTFTSDKPLYAGIQDFTQDVNNPVGTARGIYPGRVVMIHDPNATDETCNNSSLSDGYFQSVNNNQAVVDQMVSAAIRLLTGTTTDANAWNAIFRHYNQNHEKGNVGYSSSEKIFIKINATSGWDGNFNTSTLEPNRYNGYYISETSPQIVLSVLRQLIDTLGVPEGNIYIGDPMKHIYQHSYNLWHAEFPDVHYLDNDATYNNRGREQAVKSTTALIYYSDRGSILKTGSWNNANSGSPVTQDYLYQIYEQADYIINIPALKGHARAGITLFAKNHLGSNIRDDAKHLHMGLVNPDNYPSTLNPRYNMGIYRVQVDLMGHALLGGKELFYLLDGLWGGSESIDPPRKFSSTPFNTEFSSDWSSCIIVSQDPVAIESVGFDLLRNEFVTSFPFPQMGGVDDYLHQAADNTCWPAGITYDPNHPTGTTPLHSMGVHEHWNNAASKQYTRNLGTGDGIELIIARTWQGKNTDWSLSTNWSGGGVPGENDYAYIYAPIADANPKPAYPFQPVISASTTATCRNLSIMPGASLVINPGQALTVNGDLFNTGTLTIESDAVNNSGSLIVKGSSTGIITYNRVMPDSLYHYLSSPVSCTGNTLPGDYGSFCLWDEVQGDWAITTDYVPGKGYTTGTPSTGNTLSFTGTVITDDIITIEASSPYSDVMEEGDSYASRQFVTGRSGSGWGGGGWNLLGNPYTSALNVSAFIDENYSETAADNQFDPNYVALYLYNGSTYSYIGYSTGWDVDNPTELSQTHIQAGQGFFVLANNNNSSFTFRRSTMQGHANVTLHKSAKAKDPWPGLELKVNCNGKKSSAMIVYNDQMTVGLDPGYDVGLYDSGADIDVFTTLAAGNNTVNYARQALPAWGADTITVPLGINSKKGGTVTFSARTVPLDNYRFWLEDRLTGSVIELGVNSYSAVIPAETYGTGRFFLKAGTTITSIVPVIAIPDELDVRIWVSSWNTLSIEGEISDRATCTIYDISGHIILEAQLTDTNLNTVSLPVVANGIYVIKITDGNKVATKKVFL